MVADLARFLDTLRSCYDFGGRTLVSVGSGGGQFVDIYADARRVVAIDCDAAALSRLEAALVARGVRERFELVLQDFACCERRADAVVFEFSLHEIDDPAAALGHARTLAPDVLVFDHAPGSVWAWHVCEESKVAASWAAVERVGTRRCRDFRTEQVFQNRAELEARVSGQGPEALARAARFEPGAAIRIPMGYRFALL